MTSQSAWKEGWSDALVQALHRAGFLNIRGFTVARPGKKLSELAAELGGTFAPIQLVMFMGLEAKAENWTGWFAKDLLVRMIHEYCPEGWSSTSTSRFDRAHALAVWLAMLKDCQVGDPAAAEVAGQKLMEHTPLGWNPTGPNDPFILEALAGLG